MQTQEQAEIKEAENVTIAEIEKLERDVYRRETVLALARYNEKLLDDEYKARKAASDAAFEAANRELIDARKASQFAEVEAYGAYEGACKRLHAAVSANGQGKAKLTPCAEIKMMPLLGYPDAEAISYLVDHKLTQFLAIDRKAFDEAAPYLKLPFVTLNRLPKLFVTRDMVKALHLQQEDLADIEAEVVRVLSPADQDAPSAASGA